MDCVSKWKVNSVGAGAALLKQAYLKRYGNRVLGFPLLECEPDRCLGSLGKRCVPRGMGFVFSALRWDSTTISYLLSAQMLLGM